MKRLSWLAAWLCLFTGIAVAQDVTIVHAGQLLSVPGTPPLSNQSIIINGKTIEAVVPGFVEDRAGATIIDLRDMTVLPGLIDGHVHLTAEQNPKQRLQVVEMSDPDRAMLATKYAHSTLMAGFTTVRDVGARGGDAIFAVRDASNRGWIAAPRIYASGNTISITGGHGDGTQGYRDDVAHLLHSDAVCDGADDCRRAVREQIRRGADHIKLTATGGVLSNTATGTDQQFFDDELEAIMDTAHSLGRKVTAHAHGKDGIVSALKAGVDSIEHGTYTDEETARLFRRKGAYLVPTLLAGATVTEWANDPNTFLSPAQKEKAARVGPALVGMLELAHRNGVKIAFGTDSGVSRHGDNAKEFQLMVNAGMTPMEAIAAATVSGADNLGKSDSIGSIEPGKFADIIAVDEDPLTDINALLDVDFVMKEGKVYKD